MTENQIPTPAPISDAPVKTPRRRAGPSWSATFSIVLLLLVVLLGVGAWFQQKRFSNTGREVGSQLQTVSAALLQVQKESTQALALAE